MKNIKIIIHKIKNLYINKFIGNKRFNNKEKDYSGILKEYYNFIKDNIDITYDVNSEKIDNTNMMYQWVGGQFYYNDYYAIPNGMSSFLFFDKENGKQKYIGNFHNGTFKWTGGGIYNDNLYVFPRKESRLIKMNLKTHKINMIDSRIESFNEHHYGGVITEEGIAYQPPRNSDYILVWNLNINEVTKIHITPKWLNAKLRYCGSVVHPNGYIYFLPEKNNRVIKLNIETKKWKFIGKPITSMTFDVKIAGDGNIYGFSAYEQGILKIDVSNDAVTMIHKEITPGSYGTKLGLNGKLYSIPGDGDVIWEYDVLCDKLTSICKLEDQSKAKFAGGAISVDGVIYSTPATSDKILILYPSRLQNIPSKIYKTFFCDFY